MAAHPKLVNKQFNSPIGLYSSQNVQEILERETQILSNGAVGINFQNPNVGKPANLQKSAVLRMLEEEESRQRNGFGPGSDRKSTSLQENMTWPPPGYEHKNKLRSTFKDVVVPGAKRVAWPPPNEEGPDSPYVEQNSVSAKGGPQYPSQSPGFQQNNNQPAAQQRPVSPNPIHRSPLKPLDVSARGSSPLASPLLNQGPQGFRPSTPSKGWAPVHSPATTPTHQISPTPFPSAHQPVSQQTYLAAVSVFPATESASSTTISGSQPQYQSPQPQYQSPQPQYQSPQYSSKPAVAPSQAIKPVEPPPSIITLRPVAPVSQAPPPVFTSQPATATLKGGKHLRGDLKWPPENVKSQADEENRLRLELAKGPVFRPKRPQRDYTSFFAQHALNSTYPGYKIPPGTQYFNPV
ncbi:hypothetical protein JTB14_023896 [Gonioctena quinquepunctata]|nr:hypothetical protein JTB14_023896 [Gonioctena quinquepunctata]